jgi:NADPH-dependent curcumin reductase CurA
MGGSASSIPKLPNYEIGSPLEGAAIGEVLESHPEGFVEGDLVVHALAWREYGLLDPENPGHVRAPKSWAEDRRCQRW